MPGHPSIRKNRGTFSKTSDRSQTTTGPVNIKDIDRTISGDSSSMGQLLKHAHELRQLHSLIGSFLEPQLAENCQVAACRDNVLVLITPTANWATRLRMKLPDIREFLHSSDYSTINEIEIRISPVTDKQPGIRRRKSLSPAAQHTFEQFAQLSVEAGEINQKSRNSEIPDGE
jgi:hypothetical protein